jgi:hypothetical protein
VTIADDFYLDKNAEFALNKTFESWSPGTRISTVIEILEAEGDNSRRRALCTIQGIQVVIPLSYMTKLRKRTGTVPSPTREERVRMSAQNAVADEDAKYGDWRDEGFAG